MQYIEPLFRPPSEANSLILQVTNGCSWNECTFCEMYTLPHKKFKPKPQAEIEEELVALKTTGYSPRRIFLADGDAMTLSFRRLKAIVDVINKTFPDVQRIASYCLPRNLLNKSVDEMRELYEAGLSLMYVGCESGDDQVLSMVKKSETYDSSLAALKKIKAAGMKSSIMILNGLGGSEFTEQHALNSAKLMNEAQPEYLSTLVVSFPVGIERFQAGFDGRFKLLELPDLFLEMEMMLDTLELEKTIFRSDHASNYLVLKGVLNADKDKLLTKVRTAIQQPGKIPLRQEWQRGL